MNKKLIQEYYTTDYMLAFNAGLRYINNIKTPNLAVEVEEVEPDNFVAKIYHISKD